MTVPGGLSKGGCGDQAGFKSNFRVIGDQGSQTELGYSIMQVVRCSRDACRGESEDVVSVGNAVPREFIFRMV